MRSGVFGAAPALEFAFKNKGFVPASQQMVEEKIRAMN